MHGPDHSFSRYRPAGMALLTKSSLREMAICHDTGLRISRTYSADLLSTELTLAPMMLILSENHELTIDFKSRTTRTRRASILSSRTAAVRSSPSRIPLPSRKEGHPELTSHLRGKNEVYSEQPLLPEADLGFRR